MYYMYVIYMFTYKIELFIYNNIKHVLKKKDFLNLVIKCIWITKFTFLYTK